MTSSTESLRASLRIVLMLVAVAFAGGVYAQSRDVKVSGMGVRKCSDWVQWKEGRNGELRAMTLEWVQGFIAGHNIYARSGTAPASSVVADSKVLIPLLDTYCQKYPDNRIFMGVIEITQSLGGAKVNLTPKAAAPKPAPAPDAKGERES